MTNNSAPPRRGRPRKDPDAPPAARPTRPPPPRPAELPVTLAAFSNLLTTPDLLNGLLYDAVFRAYLRRAVGETTLAAREQQIMGARYGLTTEGAQTLAQIAAPLGLSRERIHQLVVNSWRQIYWTAGRQHRKPDPAQPDPACLWIVQQVLAAGSPPGADAPSAASPAPQ